MASRRRGGHGCHQWVPLGSESLSGVCSPHHPLQTPLTRPGWSTTPRSTTTVRSPPSTASSCLEALHLGPQDAGRPARLPICSEELQLRRAVGRQEAWLAACEPSDPGPVVWAFAKGSPRVISQLERSPAAAWAKCHMEGWTQEPASNDLQALGRHPQHPLPAEPSRCARIIVWMGGLWRLWNETPKCRRMATFCQGLPELTGCPGWAETQSPIMLLLGPIISPASFWGLSPSRSRARHVLLACCPSSWHHSRSPGSMLTCPS